MWGLDIIGKISHHSSIGHTYIIMMKKYFTKWVDAIPLRSITIEVICSFILEHIIAHFGIHFTLVFDDETPFKKNDMKIFLETFNIQHQFSTPYYPQSNGHPNQLRRLLRKL
jgi:hypothetical protein